MYESNWHVLSINNYLVQYSLANWICLFREKKSIPSILWPNWKLWKAHFKLWIIFWQSTSRVNSLKTHCPIFLWQLTNTQCTPMAWKAKLKWELNGVSSRTIHWIIIGNCHIWASYLNPTCVLEHFNFPLNSEQTL